MKLSDIKESSITVKELITVISHEFNLNRVGGNTRVYNVKRNQLGVIYLLTNSIKAIGIIWTKGKKTVDSLTVWNKIDFDRAPDWVLDIPPDVYIDEIADNIIDFIHSPQAKSYTINESISNKNVSPEEFITLAREFFGDKAVRLTMQDLEELKIHYSVNIPSAIKHSNVLKTGNTWNLRDDSSHIKSANNLRNASPDSLDLDDPSLKDVAKLAQLAKLNTAIKSNKIMIVGRKPNGEIFEIPGVEQISIALERSLSKQLAKGGFVSSGSMEDQYSELTNKIKLVVSGDAAFVKSLLITGGPSSGKTFRVMQVIKDAGLKAGVDYVSKKGKVTAKSMYRLFVENIDGLLIFDDCDSVMDDPNGVNMLKGALDTDPIRTVDYDVQGTYNTGNMSFEDREEFVSRMSAILKGQANIDDIEFMERKAGISYTAASSDDSLPDWYKKESQRETLSAERLQKVESWCRSNLPNKIDFKGRIIFISNMKATEWDSAILTRAFHQNMDFSDIEMLDYIESIKDHIKTPKLSKEDKQKVIDYIRELWTSGKINRPINFRLIQQAFDLYLIKDWKKMLSSIG